MSITIKAVTEASRDKMHKEINNSTSLTDDSVVKASQELDQKILAEMIRQDPKIENIYLKNVIKSKDQEIRTLQKKNYENEVKLQRINDIIESAVMRFETGMMAINSIDLAVKQAREEGLTV